MTAESSHAPCYFLGRVVDPENLTVRASPFAVPVRDAADGAPPVGAGRARAPALGASAPPPACARPPGGGGCGRRDLVGPGCGPAPPPPGARAFDGGGGMLAAGSVGKTPPARCPPGSCCRGAP